MSEQTQAPAPKKKIVRRVMLPEVARVSEETADAEDARRVRWAMSTSYHVLLSQLVGNRWTGHHEMLPRRLYRFGVVRPTGINERRERMDEDTDEEKLQTVRREPRTCAEDAAAVAGTDTGFVVFESLTGREDGEEIWNVLYPVETEARVWMMTGEHLRTPWVKGAKVEEHLLSYFEEAGLRAPYRLDGHALAEFIRHLEDDAPGLVRSDETLSAEQRGVALDMLAEALAGAREAFQQRYSRLHTSQGLINERKNTGLGKKKFDSHDFECLAETGVVLDADKPVEASQRMGEAIGEQIAEGQKQTNDKLADAVTALTQATVGRSQTEGQRDQLFASAMMLIGEMGKRLGIVPDAGGETRQT